MRRAVAEVTGATPGASVVVLRSLDPGRSAALGGLLCIDRSRAAMAGLVRAADVNGRATIPLAVGPYFGVAGFETADHLQAIVLSSSPEPTNALAWLP